MAAVAGCLVIGEALFDAIWDPTQPHLDLRPGGGPANAARTLARLGAEVELVTGIGTDLLGQRLLDDLVGDGVGCSWSWQSSWPTTLALATLQQGAADYQFYLARTALDDPRGSEHIQRAMTELTPSLLLAGGLGLTRRAVAASILNAFAETTSALRVLDPNVRVGAADDPAAYRELLWSLVAHTDVLKLSGEDLSWLAPHEEPLAACSHLLELGTRLIVVTNGSEPVVLVDRTGQRTLPVPALVDLVDTIGAGDAFTGALCCVLLTRGATRSDLTLVADEAAAFATDVATATCRRRGADPPHLHDLPAKLRTTLWHHRGTEASSPPVRPERTDPS